MPRIDEASALLLGEQPVSRVYLGDLGVWPRGTVPVNVLLPEIMGTFVLGETLTATEGTWTNNPTEFTYAWFQGDVLVGTGPSYEAVNPGELVCRVTATNTEGSTMVDSSAVMVWSPEGTYTTFAPGLASMTIEPGGMVAHKINNTDPPHYGHCTTADPIQGKVYIEVLLTFDSPYGNASVFHFYGGTQPASAYSAEDSIGWWWDEPGAAIGMTSEWTAITFANRNLPNQVENSSMYTFTRNPFPVTRRFFFCVDADTRYIWFRTEDGPTGWVGGGDPALGTNPTVILGGTGSIYAGATSAYITNVVEMVHPDIYSGQAPAGFIKGIRTDGE